MHVIPLAVFGEKVAAGYPAPADSESKFPSQSQCFAGVKLET
jgi:hypothetical protein